VSEAQVRGEKAGPREGAEAGAGTMLVARRLTGLSAREGHYAGLFALTQSGVCHTYVILRLAAGDRYDRE
jgi:hypothetical protein